MKSIRWIIIATLLLAGCGTTAPAQPALPFVLVTAAPNASPTPTPFQPIPWTPTGTLQAQPEVDAAIASATLTVATQTDVPTMDPNFLINTVAPCPPSTHQVARYSTTGRRRSTSC